MDDDPLPADPGLPPGPIVLPDDGTYDFYALVHSTLSGPTLISANAVGPGLAVHLAARALSGYPAPRMDYVSVPRGALGIAVRRRA